MYRNLFGVFIFMAALSTVSVYGGQPVISQHLPSATVREMDIFSPAVVATESAGHALAYDWSFTADQTRVAYFLTTPGNRAHIGIPWLAASAAGQLNGRKVTVKVIARHANAADGAETAESSATLTISGVNHPPVPIIGGRLGTPAARIPSGNGVCANCYDSTGPDADSFRAHKPAGAPTPTNRAPTVNFPQNPVVATLGGTAQLVADAEDLDGDVLDYSFVFLQAGSTVASSAVSVQTLSTTKKRVTATIPASAAGTFTFRFTARERNTTDRKAASAIITLQVTSGAAPGDGGPGDVTDTPSNCAASNVSPTITITPNPTTSKPLYRSGNSATITVTAFDSSERQSPLLPSVVDTGATVTWELSELAGLGINPSVVSTKRAADKRYTDSTLTFNVPTVSAGKDVYLTVHAADVFDCTRTIRFAIRVEPAQTSNNQPPVARIQYKVGSGSYTNAPATPVTIETDSAVTVTLKGDTSTDDGGSSNLTYSWAKQNSIAAGSVTLGSTTGATTTVLIGAHTRGTLTVTLTAKDQANLADASTISFDIIDPALKPIARVAAKVGGQAVVGPVEEGILVTLDGSASSRRDNTKNNLTYQWTQTSGPSVGIVNANNAVASFTVPSASEGASWLRFQLIVSDAGTPSDPAELIVDLGVPSLYFSQVAVGPLGTRQFRTVLLLVNNNETAANGVDVRFFDQNGDPMNVNINGVPWTGQPFDILPLASKRLVFSGQELKVGWAKVKANVKLVGLLQYQVVGEDGNLESQVGLYSTEAAHTFASFYDPETETAIAVANPTSQPAEVMIQVIDEKTGNQVVSKPLFLNETGGALPGMNQRAKFLTPEFVGLPPDFTIGTLLIQSDVPIAVTILETKGGVVFSTLPAASTR